MVKREDTRFDHVDVIPVIKEENKLTIGEDVKLVVDLENQDNYIEMNGRKIPYYREVQLSKELLEGKREKVYRTAVEYYYKQACSVAEGIRAAEQYRSRANKTVREK